MKNNKKSAETVTRSDIKFIETELASIRPSLSPLSENMKIVLVGFTEAVRKLVHAKDGESLETALNKNRHKL